MREQVRANAEMRDVFVLFIYCSGSSINDVTFLEGGYKGFCEDSDKVLFLKSVTLEKGVSKIIKNCMTSIMNDSLSKIS